MVTDRPFIDSLPNEIVLEIFNWVKHFNDLDGDSHTCAPSCTSISQTSKRWRRLAISDMKLWNNLPRYGAAAHWTALSYERSLGALLNLRLLMRSTNARTKMARDLASEHVSRARSIYLLIDLLERGSEGDGVFPAMESLTRIDSALAKASHLRELHLENQSAVTPAPRAYEYRF